MKVGQKILLAAILAAAFAPSLSAAAPEMDFDRGFDIKAALEEIQVKVQAPAPAREEYAGVSRAIPAQAPAEHPGAVIGEPLDPVFFSLGEGIKHKSKVEWQRRLKANGRRAAIAPLDPIDPSKKLVVFIPGIGLNYQDAYALARLNDTYQFVIVNYNQKYTLNDNGRQVAEAVEALMRYRIALAEARGIKTDRELRLIGHSFGGLVGQLMLANLVQKGLVHDGPGSLFPKSLYLCVDAGWRGFDAPWIFMLPGVKHIVGEILPRIPLPKKATHSALTVVNRTGSMNTVLNLRLPDNVTVRMVNVPAPGPQKMIEPVNGWYSFELGKGELRKIREFLRTPSSDGNRLDGWKWGILIRKQGLQQLWQTLERDSDFKSYEAGFYQAAVQSKTLEEFKVRYDEIIARIVDTFHGQHTRFMWEDPTFMPWLREALAEW
ncbi:MAG: GPI inositol-deacylase [Elusimicrobia bacterium]|nr:GPI inositol-deacylase [Elusimicrobiota bacterium]